jgi:magnesium chelatase family protein
MNISASYSAHLVGLDSEKVTVEVDISNGLHSFSIIGLGDRSVEEAKDRISAAIKNSGYISPKQKNQKVVISLAPADVRKEGTSFDVAMAMAYLKGSGDIDFEHENILFLGELSLDGRLRKVHGVLPILLQAPSLGFTTAFIPKENAAEAGLAENIIIFPAGSINEIISHLNRTKKIKPVEQREFLDHASGRPSDRQSPLRQYDMSLIKGNETAKRALEIAVAGCHNIMLYGPPGTGKTMLAKSALSIMPPLSYAHAREVSSIHSVARSLDQEPVSRPPFRAPHHSASSVSIIGGGQQIRPGEVTLAHRGILFMDEFPEFDRDVIEALRQPLEEREIIISRVRGLVTFPAQCMLIASMNPCRCDRLENICSCSRRIIEAYKKRLSAPILDRIDMWIEVNKVDYDKLSASKGSTETSADIRERVSMARSRQLKRFSSSEHRKNLSFNSEMSAQEIEEGILFEDDAREALRLAAKSMGISARSFHRTIKVARTIADLDGSEKIQKRHILEALQYRHKVR